MYEIGFVYDNEVMDRVRAYDQCEQVWSDTGFDLLEFQLGLTSTALGSVQEALAELKDNPTYYRETHGEEAYNRTLVALEQLAECCESWPEAVLDVRY